MQRIIALDIGSVRIGVAVSDPLGFFAQGVAVLDAKGDWHAELAKIAGQYERPKLLIGMPRRTDGSEGPEAVRMRETAKSVQEYFPSLRLSSGTSVLRRRSRSRHCLRRTFRAREERKRLIR